MQKGVFLEKVQGVEKKWRRRMGKEKAPVVVEESHSKDGESVSKKRQWLLRDVPGKSQEGVDVQKRLKGPVDVNDHELNEVLVASLNWPQLIK